MSELLAFNDDRPLANSTSETELARHRLSNDGLDMHGSEGIGERRGSWLAWLWRSSHQPAEVEAAAVVEAYRSAVELEPSEPQAYLHAGQAMYNMQRFDEAIAAFTSAGEGTPPHTPRLRTSAPPHSPHHETSALHRRAPSCRREHPWRPALA